MGDRNRTRYAILGALSLGPSSGYQMKRDLDQTVGHFWSESFGQIYPILARLQREGLIRVADDGGTGRQPRRIYDLTPTGRIELEEWLAEPVEDRSRPRSELLLKLFFGASLPVAASLGHVRAHRASVLSQLATLRAIQSEVAQDSAYESSRPYWMATLRYGLLVGEAVVAWCDETIAALTPSTAQSS